MAVAPKAALALAISAAAIVAGVASPGPGSQHASFAAARHAHLGPLSLTPKVFPQAVLHFVVDTEADTDATPTAIKAGQCADANGLCSLRGAFDVADATQEAVSVTLPKGVYELQNGELVDQDPAGITLLGAGESDTIISAKGESPAARVIDIGIPTFTKPQPCLPDDNSSGMLEASDLTITGGDAPDSEASNWNPYGGGIALENETTTAVLSKVDITGNTADDEYGDAPIDGGGVFDDGSLWLIDSTLSDNTAGSVTSQYGYGGGLAVYQGAAVLENSSITRNQALGGGEGSDSGIVVIKKGLDNAPLNPVAIATSTNSKLLYYFAASGGGIVNDGGSLTLDGGSVSDNSVIGNDNADEADGNAEELASDPPLGGGGLWLDEEALVDGTTFAGNSVTSSAAATSDEIPYSSYGGAIFDGYGLSSIEGATIVANSALSSPESDNEANLPKGSTGVFDEESESNGLPYPGGGAVYDFSGLTISHSVVSRNIAGEGEGGAVDDEGNGTSLVDDTVDYNSATAADPCDDCLDGAGFGGALYGDDAATLLDSSVSGNTASAGGGGLYLNDSTSIDGSTISGNSANFGGGVLAGYDFIANDSTIADNLADDAGGGIFVVGFENLDAVLPEPIKYGTAPPAKKGKSSRTPATTTGSDRALQPHGAEVTARINLSYVTISGNVSPNGAGILDAGGDSAAAGGVILASIVDDNTAPGGKAEIDCQTTVLEGESPAPVVSAGFNLFGERSCGDGATDDISVKADLGHLADNGGVTDTVALLPGSPAIGAVPGMMCEGSDQRGIARLARGASSCDSGAYELLSDPPAVTPPGYLLVSSGGAVYAFGSARWQGSVNSTERSSSVVGIAIDPATHGYWVAESSGRVVGFDAPSYELARGRSAPSDITGIEAMSNGKGFWLVSGSGGVWNYGDAPYFGSMTSRHLNQPVLSLTPTADGGGYYLLASDGGVFTFGDAGFHGSTGADHLTGGRIVAMSVDQVSGGYWLTSSDGAVYGFDARSFGSMAGTHLNKPVLGIESSPVGRGYYLVAADGGVFTFGALHFYGSLGATHIDAPIVAMAFQS